MLFADYPENAQATAVLLYALAVVIPAIGGLILKVYLMVKEDRRRAAHDRKEAKIEHASLHAKADENGRGLEAMASGQLMRGRIEAEDRELIGADGIRQDVLEVYSMLLPNLRELYEANPGISRARYALLVEEKFGKWLVKNICRPYQVSNNACWEIAVQLTMGPDPVGIPPCPDDRRPDSWEREHSKR